MFATWTPVRREKLAKALFDHLHTADALPAPGDAMFWFHLARAVNPPPIGTAERATLAVPECDASVEPDALRDELYDELDGVAPSALHAEIEEILLGERQRPRHRRAAKRSRSASRKSSEGSAPGTPADSPMKRSQSSFGIARMVGAPSSECLVKLGRVGSCGALEELGRAPWGRVGVA
jgi:hypothetical protein